MSIFANCFTGFFSNLWNHLQTRCYARFTKRKLPQQLVIMPKVIQLELRSLIPNIVLFMILFSPTVYSEIFQTFRKVARMLQWTFPPPRFCNWHFTILVFLPTYPSDHVLRISELQMLYCFSTLYYK